MMKTELLYFDETSLAFADGQLAIHPRDGLTIFGPYDSKGINKPKQLVYGLFGTQDGIAAFKAFSSRLRLPIPTSDGMNPLLWPHFPGFEEAFHTAWEDQPTTEEAIDERALHDSAHRAEAAERVYGTAELYMEKMRIAKVRDERFDVFICVVPDYVHLNCRMRSKVTKPTGERQDRKMKADRRRLKMASLFDATPEQYEYSLDFRRQLKARAMELEVPIQIVRESTLRLSDENRFGIRGLTPMSDRAWNLATALYYKAGGKPWKLAGGRDGVCYIGIAFKDVDQGKNKACCAAQMFLDDGDGVVFVGEYGPWYSPVDKQYQLPKDSAQSLLSKVLKTYTEQHGGALKEVFVHCRSGINPEAIEGYQAACPPGVKLVAVRVAEEKKGLRLYRKGTRPVLRGTFWPVSERRGFLWASGFKPRLATYEGSDVPVPLRIDIQYGDTDLETVARDIFALTKLNYNCCKLGEDQPVTVNFSDAVGEILIANNIKVKHPNFKYYI